jgi:hypothetical protein
MGTNTRSKTAKQNATNAAPWLAPLVIGSSYVFIVALIAGGLALLILLGLTVLGKSDFPQIENIKAAMSLGLTVGMITWMLARGDTLAPGWVGLGLAPVFYLLGSFVVPLLAGIGKVSDKTFLEGMISAMTTLAVTMIVISVLRLIIGLFAWYKDQQVFSTKRLKYIDTDTKDAQSISMIPKCWQMSRCRPGVRMSCPNYIDRQTCWSRRSGCFCDRELANYLIQSVDRGETSEVAEVTTTATTEVRNFAGRSRPWKLQKTLCYNCPLFIEHQEYKFKHLRWMSLPVTGLIAFILWAPFVAGFQWASDKLFELTNKLIAMSNMPEDFKPHPTDLTGGFMIFVGCILIVLLASYVMAFTERIFLKWNL